MFGKKGKNTKDVFAQPVESKPVNSPQFKRISSDNLSVESITKLALELEKENE